MLPRVVCRKRWNLTNSRCDADIRQFPPFTWHQSAHAHGIRQRHTAYCTTGLSVLHSPLRSGYYYYSLLILKMHLTHLTLPTIPNLSQIHCSFSRYIVHYSSGQLLLFLRPNELVVYFKHSPFFCCCHQLPTILFICSHRYGIEQLSLLIFSTILTSILSVVSFIPAIMPVITPLSSFSVWVPHLFLGHFLVQLISFKPSYLTPSPFSSPLVQFVPLSQ